MPVMPRIYSSFYKDREFMGNVQTRSWVLLVVILMSGENKCILGIWDTDMWS